MKPDKIRKVLLRVLKDLSVFEEKDINVIEKRNGDIRGYIVGFECRGVPISMQWSEKE